MAAGCVCCCCLVEQFIEFGLHPRELRLIRSAHSESVHNVMDLVKLDHKGRIVNVQ